ncbi:coproporphyrinogen III oxidase [Enterovibrio norvegicus FF-33]|uniref:DUF2489 domain-containing protein n=1 Tax=Enterovibrio norvegicus TaxID=188144 RepID=UPI000303658B|nr:DUF2489 domain-containing protein [Enterovibrio norvegicus]OEE71171.1 coproporphyrinogen III oxidase [Enterovibrio norvegicus FF-33]
MLETLPLGVLALGGAIILGLAIYAGWLLAKLRHQTKLQAAQMDAATKKRNLKIIESVDVIAMATLQEQCDFSEAAIRLFMIMDHLQGEKRVDYPTRYPALYELYDVVKDMPRGDARKAIDKKERMRDNMVRMKTEARLQQAIHTELEEILAFTGAKMTPIRTLAS